MSDFHMFSLSPRKGSLYILLDILAILALVVHCVKGLLYFHTFCFIF